MPINKEVRVMIKAFQPSHWSALWQLRAHQLAEQGIVITDEIPSQPDLKSPYETDLHRLGQIYQKGRGNFWIAWLDDDPVGYIGAEDKEIYIELRRMYVREKYRRIGIGGQLVRVLINHCRERGVGKIKLWTAEKGPGRFLYEKQGFYEVVEERVTITNEKSEIRMCLILREEVR